MNMHRSRSPERGVSVVEVLVGITVLSVGLLGLAQGAVLGLRVTSRARSDMQFYADAQQVMDSLVSRGWNKVATGSTTVRGRAVSWTVSTVSPKQQKLTMTVARPSYQDPNAMTTETLVVYLANPAMVP
jgi:Tfp pilus assembly protein PilV